MSNRPAPAFDYRRHIAIVQALASEHPEQNIRALCEAWGIPQVEMYPDDGSHTLDTVIALAKAAVEYHRSERE